MSEGVKIKRNAQPGRLDNLFPSWLYTGFVEYIQNLEKLFPGLIANSYIVAPEIKYHMPRFPITDGFEVATLESAGCYVIGNCAGYTDSISTAGTMGIVAARDIRKKYVEQNYD